MALILALPNQKPLCTALLGVLLAQQQRKKQTSAMKRKSIRSTKGGKESKWQSVLIRRHQKSVYASHRRSIVVFNVLMPIVSFN